MTARRRFGRPQVYALLLLFAFLAQAIWITHVRPLTRVEVAYLRAGLDQFHGNFVDPGAPVVPTALAASAVLIARRAPESFPPDHLKWMVRLPFIGLGWLLGASIWYVSRRLYGDGGGYLALTLYCFSPFRFFVIPGPTVTGSLGAFGMVFVAIAAAHTLYAPPQSSASHPLAGLAELQVRWRRILLLAFAIALAVGSSYWLVFLLILAAAFMAYIIPEREFQALGLMIAACVVAFAVLLSLHGFHGSMYWFTLRKAPWLPLGPRGATWTVFRAYLARAWRSVSPPVLLLTVAAVAGYAGASRSRYFGNTAPLVALVFLMIFSLLSLSGVYAGPFPLLALPFLYVFIAGVFADFVETRFRPYVLAFTLAMLAIYIGYALVEISKARVSVLY